MADDLPLSPPLLQQVPLSSLAAIAKQGQTLQPQNIQADMSSIAPAVANTVGNLTGVNDAVKALRGQMTPEEAQTFALGAIPGAMVGPEAKVAETAAEEAVPLASKVIQGIKAYHGSPYDFNQFDLSKIGTGEGAQSYGHGLYFAENPATAEDYKNTLAQTVAVGGNPILKNNRIVGSTGNKNVDDMLIAHNGDLEAAITDLKSHMSGLTPGQLARAGHEHELNTLEGLRGQVTSQNTGKMYEVNINADPEHFMDYDKPLSDQSDYVKQAASKVFGVPVEQMHDQLYLQRPSPQIADALNQAGIPGVKYLDQGSRPTRSLQDTTDSIQYYTKLLKDEPDNQFAQQMLGQYQDDLNKYQTGTRNYVVFNDKIVDILKKYGLAGLLGGGGIGAMAQQQPQMQQ